MSGRVPGVPDSPKAVNHPRGDSERDEKNEPAVGRVIDGGRGSFPSGQGKAEQSEQASGEHADQ